MPYRIIWIFCLIFVGGILTLSFLNKRENTAISPVASNDDKPSVSFKNIDMIINSPTGQPQYKLASPKYWLYEQEQKSEFDSPNIEIYNKDGSVIYATSKKGETYNENDVITLIGDVEITQPATNEDPNPLNIFTDKISVSQSAQQVTTDLPVTASRGSQKITALGMTLNLNTKILQLHSNVKARHDP